MNEYILKGQIYEAMQLLYQVHLCPLHLIIRQVSEEIELLSVPEFERDVLWASLVTGGPDFNTAWTAERINRGEFVYLDDPTDSSLYYGMLQLKNNWILIAGPTGKPEENTVTGIGQNTKEQLKAMLTLLRKTVSSDDSEDVAACTQNQKNSLLVYQIGKLDYENDHHSFSLEEAALKCIEEGDYASYQKIRAYGDQYSHGMLAHTAVKEQEYSTVLEISFYIRAAIRGGLDQQKAYDMNDLYLQRVSTVCTQEEYQQILSQAAYEICKEVKKARSRRKDSPYVEQCKQLVARNLNKDLTLEFLAECLKLSPAYLSSHFSEHEGMTIKQYIINERVKAAKNMLRFSDYDISQIAQYLNFGTQSHFGSVFKKVTGMTPNAYRRQFWIK